ncbi:MAG: response regulator [Acidobacteriota bacterium]
MSGAGPDREHQPEAREAALPCRRRVLVVDDDPEILELTQMILRDGGYEVCTQSSGKPALGEARTWRPDLILLDINMPDMDGWEVLRLLKVDERTRSIPVALFSIRYDVREKVVGLQQGAFDYITKPFSYDGLLERIERIFHRLAPPA